MPFNKHFTPDFVNTPVIVDKLEQVIDENGAFQTVCVKYDASAHAFESPSYKNYSLRSQLESGDTIKKVNTCILADDLDSITCEQVSDYFNDEGDENKDS